MKGEDYVYICEQRGEGLLAYLKAPVFSEKQYFGEICETEKAAEVSAASTFCADGDVVSAAALLPPTVTVLKSKAHTDQLVGW